MKDETIERTRLRLIESATDLLAKNPGASMGRIAAAAGVGRATLHRYFARREDLVREIALEAIRRTDEAVAPVYGRSQTAREALRLTLEAVIPLGGSYAFLLNEPIAMNDPEVATQYERQVAGTRELGEALKAEGNLAPDVPTAWFAAAFDAIIYAAWQAVADGEIAPKAAGDFAFRTLMQGLSTPAYSEGASSGKSAQTKKQTAAKSKTRAKKQVKKQANKKTKSAKKKARRG